MGIYVNPQDGRTREKWLEEEGIRLSPAQAREFQFGDDTLPVCLVDNGFMTAAGVGYSAAERDVFAASDDRPKEWFLVEISKLLTVTPPSYHSMMGR